MSNWRPLPGLKRAGTAILPVRQYAGIRFRMIDEQNQMRRHVRFFVNGEQVFELTHVHRPDDEVQIVQALSGG